MSENPTPAPTPGWAKSPGRARPAPTGPGRATSVMIVLGLLSAAVGALVAILMWIEWFPHPRFLPVAISEYPAGVPVLPFAGQDADALLGLKWSGRSSGRNSQERKLLVGELDTLANFDPKTPAVLYVNGYLAFGPAGGKGQDGEEVPYLLPSDARMEDRSTWVPLSRLLGALQACPAKHKLLLLDVMRPLLWPARGLVRSDVTRRVWPALEQGTAGGVLILTACSPGQVSHAAEELGYSVFAYHLRQGLTGAADRNGDRFVSMRELAGYVTEGVDRWVAHHRGERQTPVLLGEMTGDFYLTNQKDAPRPPPGLPGDYPNDLTAGWRKHDDWWQAGVEARRRAVFLKLGRALVEEDGRWRGGRAVGDGLRDKLARLTREYLELAPPPPGAETTLAERLARVPVPPADPEDRKALQRAAARRDMVPEGKAAEDALKPIQAEVGRLAKGYKDRPAELARLVLGVARDDPFGPDAAALLAGLLAEARGVEDLEEVRYLTRLARRAGPHWSPEVARLAVDASCCSAEARVAAGRLGAVPADLEGRRRRADDLLFAGEQPWDGPARELLRKLPEGYRLARRGFDDLRAAEEAVDDVFCLLPSYPLAPEVRAADVAACRQVLARARKLRTLLAAPDRISRLDEIRPLTREVRHGPDSLNSLLAPLQEDGFPRLIKATRLGKKAETLKCRLLMSTPWPTADQRLTLWSAVVEGASAGTGGGSGALPAWDEVAIKQAHLTLRGRDLVRASAFVASLVARADVPPEGLEAALADLERRPASSAAWAKFAQALRATWQE